MMLQRNLLYTGVTRARKLVVLVGSKQAIAMAVRNDRIASRNTRLSRRLKEYVLPKDANQQPGRAVSLYKSYRVIMGCARDYTVTSFPLFVYFRISTWKTS
jgi:hypothetical protein